VKVVVERHETTRVIDKGHDIKRCMLNVAASPRAARTSSVTWPAWHGTLELLDVNEWQPVVRSLADLGDVSGSARRYL
jgi:hypothetical protein